MATDMKSATVPAAEQKTTFTQVYNEGERLAATKGLKDDPKDDAFDMAILTHVLQNFKKTTKLDGLQDIGILLRTIKKQLNTYVEVKPGYQHIVTAEKLIDAAILEYEQTHNVAQAFSKICAIYNKAREEDGFFHGCSEHRKIAKRIKDWAKGHALEDTAGLDKAKAATAEAEAKVATLQALVTKLQTQTTAMEQKLALAEADKMRTAGRTAPKDFDLKSAAPSEASTIGATASLVRLDNRVGGQEKKGAFYLYKIIKRLREANPQTNQLDLLVTAPDRKGVASNETEEREAAITAIEGSYAALRPYIQKDGRVRLPNADDVDRFEVVKTQLAAIRAQLVALARKEAIRHRLKVENTEPDSNYKPKFEESICGYLCNLLKDKVSANDKDGALFTLDTTNKAFLKQIYGYWHKHSKESGLAVFMAKGTITVNVDAHSAPNGAPTPTNAVVAAAANGGFLHRPRAGSTASEEDLPVVHSASHSRRPSSDLSSKNGNGVGGLEGGPVGILDTSKLDDPVVADTAPKA